MMPAPTVAPTAGDLRAEIARRRLKLYVLAPLVRMHPNNLSQVLRERRPLTPDLAARLMRVIGEAAPPA
jgi:plasmid maintenance system antidote protein VapI